MLFHHFYGVAFSFFGHQTIFAEYPIILFFCLLSASFFLHGDIIISYAAFLEILADQYHIQPSRFFHLAFILKCVEKFQWQRCLCQVGQIQPKT